MSVCIDSVFPVGLFVRFPPNLNLLIAANSLFHPLNPTSIFHHKSFRSYLAMGCSFSTQHSSTKTSRTYTMGCIFSKPGAHTADEPRIIVHKELPPVRPRVCSDPRTNPPPIYQKIAISTMPLSGIPSPDFGSVDQFPRRSHPFASSTPDLHSAKAKKSRREDRLTLRAHRSVKAKNPSPSPSFPGSDLRFPVAKPTRASPRLLNPHFQGANKTI